MIAIAGTPCRRRHKRLLLLCLSPLWAAGCMPGGSPTADAGDDQVVDAGANVTLDGSASGGGSLTFFWRQIQGTQVSLSSASAPIVTFTAPAVGTNLVFELTVSNALGSSVDTVTVSVRPVDESARVVEMRQPSIRDDPAITGDFPDGWTIPGLPEGPQKVGKGAAAWIDQITYAPTVDVDLAPGATRTAELQVAGPSVLMGTVRWIGTADPLPVSLALDGTPLTTVSGYSAGTSYSIGTDRGGSAVRAKTTAGGQASLSVTNTSGATVKIRLIFGAVAL